MFKIHENENLDVLGGYMGILSIVTSFLIWIVLFFILFKSSVAFFHCVMGIIDSIYEDKK